MPCVLHQSPQLKSGAVESSAELGASLPITSKKVPWTELLPSLQLLEAGASSVPVDSLALLTRPPLVTPGMPSSPNLPWCYVAGASSVPNYSKRACDDCRYCPEFSALYGHKVYICKRLEGVAELA